MNAKNKTAQVPFIGTTKTTEPFFSVYIIEQKLILKGGEKIQNKTSVGIK